MVDRTAQFNVWASEMTSGLLPSWNDGVAKSAIFDFVARVTTEGSSDYVRPAERIATFNNDGTLWCEQSFSSCKAGGR